MATSPHIQFQLDVHLMSWELHLVQEENMRWKTPTPLETIKRKLIPTLDQAKERGAELEEQRYPQSIPARGNIAQADTNPRHSSSR